MSPGNHDKCTAVRAKASADRFGCSPSAVFPPHAVFKQPNERFLIDVFVYTLGTSAGDIDVAVTNGMSDLTMDDPDDPLRTLSRSAVDSERSRTKSSDETRTSLAIHLSNRSH
jgi:hypothetical protein